MQIIGGKHRKRKLTAPKTTLVRPTASMVRESLFNICQQSIDDADFLDLFAGAGAIGLEALSRGAKHVTFVENNREAIQTIRKNIALLKEEEHTTLFSRDVFEALKILSKNDVQFDLIFADPPYGTSENSISNQILSFVDQNPILKEGGELFLEDSIEASEEAFPLSRLHLKSRRKLGRAVLRQYILRENG